MSSAPEQVGPVGLGVGNLAALARLDRRALRHLWRELLERPPPQASQTLLVCCLAYRMQENASGGLSAAARLRLREIAQKLAAASATAQPLPSRMAPGTRLIRQWRAQRHEVMVLEQGYAYRGSRYTSLSAIARIISGSHCSGPRFFGLKSNATAKSSTADAR